MQGVPSIATLVIEKLFPVLDRQPLLPEREANHGTIHTLMAKSQDKRGREDKKKKKAKKQADVPATAVVLRHHPVSSTPPPRPPSSAE